MACVIVLGIGIPTNRQKFVWIGMDRWMDMSVTLTRKSVERIKMKL